MNGSPSVKVALFIRNGGSESPCRWFYVTEIYNAVDKHIRMDILDICNKKNILAYELIYDEKSYDFIKKRIN